MKCKIQWIDKHGNPTPDDNDAVAMAHHHAHAVGPNGTMCEDTSWPICADHARQLSEDPDGFKYWSLDPLP